MRWLFLILFCSTLALAQGVRIGDGQPLMTTASINGVTVLVPVASANISICNHPANAVPCTNRITTYTDVTLTTACTGANQVVLANTSSCVAAADVRGNWGAWASTGTYDWTFTNSSGNSFGPYTVSATSPAYTGTSGSLGQIVETSTPNDGVTGTTAGRLAKQVNNTVINCANADAASDIKLFPIATDITGSCGAGTSGTACKVIGGKASVTMDAGGVTQGHFVGCSGTQAPKGTDLGASVPPGQGCAGMAVSTVVGGQPVVIDTDACAVPASTGYSTVKVAGAAVTQRSVLNFVNGLTCADNGGTSATDCSQGSIALPTGSAASPSFGLASFPNGPGFYGSSGELKYVYNHSDIFQIGQGGFTMVNGVSCLIWATDNTYGTQTAKIASDGNGNFYFGKDANCGTVDTGIIHASNLKLASPCVSSASPAVCGSSTSGVVALAAGGTTLTVNTSAVSATSIIILTRDNGLGTALSVTCNTQSSLVLGTPYVSARVGSTSFTITVDVGPTTNPMCIGYQMVNN